MFVKVCKRLLVHFTEHSLQSGLRKFCPILEDTLCFRVELARITGSRLVPRLVLHFCQSREGSNRQVVEQGHVGGDSQTFAILGDRIWLGLAPSAVVVHLIDVQNVFNGQVPSIVCFPGACFRWVCEWRHVHLCTVGAPTITATWHLLVALLHNWVAHVQLWVPCELLINLGGVRRTGVEWVLWACCDCRVPYGSVHHVRLGLTSNRVSTLEVEVASA
mmetsp:Transcript_14977/g.34125  ORF Transcript_14977/g.34125 Transcript_14977/m.34125 type:complete len:218 (-) Transcript_14977:668-1321(-)